MSTVELTTENFEATISAEGIGAPSQAKSI